MKVSLATQLLSSSVAKVLRTMKHMNVKFNNCEATADFIEVMIKLLIFFNCKMVFHVFTFLENLLNK